jgi:hypothetical protein
LQTSYINLNKHQPGFTTAIIIQACIILTLKMSKLVSDQLKT